MIGRRLIIIVVALLLAIQVVRNAAVAALAPLRPAAAEKFWSAHPDVEISLGLSEIGRASRERRPIDRQTFAMIDDAAEKSPLASEPFLVRGVQAQLAGNAESAKRAFLAAQWRDPRSMPAAYFLADHFFRAGDALHGLEQTALLARLSPGGTASVTPYVAAYAQNRANWPQMRALFRAEAGLEDGVLIALAQDARNTDAILAIADQGHRQPDSAWLPILLNSLVRDGDYAPARAIWSSISHANAGSALLYDANFTAAGAPPPFNWALTSSSVGLAERQPGKGLHAIFYGNQDGVLASELLLLPSGTYRLQVQMNGSPLHPEALRLSVRCDKGSGEVASIPLDQAAARGWTFQVPPSCPAEWIELSGQSTEFSQQSDVTIRDLILRRQA